MKTVKIDTMATLKVGRRTQGRDVIGAVEADKLFDLERREAEVSVRQSLWFGGVSTGECISER